MKPEILNENHRLGLGGVAIGTAFGDITDEQANEIFSKAWDLGIRYYDTSPWYGLTKSERRFGSFLKDKNREDFILSTKVGRIFTEVPEADVPPTMWQNPLNYDFKHDYTADAIKRSIEESLQRTGLDRLDIVYVHDLSEDQVGDRYPYFLEQAKKGAFKVLSELRDQGVIKAWGMGVNKIEPILDCIDNADPDICLSATQYSILDHDFTVDVLLPAVKKAGVKLVSGAGYNSGFIAGRNRYNYKELIPKGMTEKRDRIKAIAQKYNTNIVHAALQFVLAADEFVSIIPGASKPEQVQDNVDALHADIPAEFWKELKSERLIYEKAQVPGDHSTSNQ
ncbi:MULTISPECIES: aldo/keto reductase [Chryseobacterium]|uniref:D-threo-aldose 1-dehydrogenase n=1 Tax=Chryseobacterium camelliae TaxID=1265445 RepID=A0ABU0TGQ0_9FLAO|nr:MULTISPECIES: aldo/keto reductase [Chryseobacterium]MDT3405970.1 D-threo-aldose 1-dehydrogenase [Pseudacidovorax intermedius]MDQ1096227.1 D-threo-aldose 1-dehydrogenase [Chryseobacterium camelliae]MDQ1100164.1 D-threo-aldose 1-dehydrogenase [Chryseobacterium sp. SORGH_AS_1048]MDR6087507.1 D-threo-aldose 1-dehydrogenase [Chryseobacterium sp. SORGH_AS_0909]MDR6131881.1 D-threo-aldose 1-dehydrogenase [Chryseobacterium sp. SORGH_AS_1175]